MNKKLFRVEYNRETIGSIDVVDAEFADELVTACANVLRWTRKVSTVKHGLRKVAEELGNGSAKYRQVVAEREYSSRQLTSAMRSLSSITKKAVGEQVIHEPIDLSHIHADCEPKG